MKIEVYPKEGKTIMKRRPTSNMVIVFGIGIACVSVCSADIIELEEHRGIGVTQFVDIDPDLAQVSESQDTGFKTTFGNRDDLACVSYDGSVIVANYRVVRPDMLPEAVVDIPEGENNIGYFLPKLSSSGQIVVYTSRHHDRSSIIWFDTIEAKIVGRFDIRDLPYIPAIVGLDASADANTVAYFLGDAGGERVYIIERTEQGLSSPIPVARVGAIQSSFFMASSGDRLFYSASVPPDSGATITSTFFVERTIDGWSEPSPVELPGGTPIYVLYDVGNDGQSLLVYAGSEGLAVVHEEENGWSEPDYVGYQPTTKDYTRMSEDASVIALSGARLPLPEFRMGFLTPSPKYDLYAFVKGGDGGWLQTRVNPESVLIWGRDFLLSGDGKSLYWVPETWRSASSLGDDWRLHGRDQ